MTMWHFGNTSVRSALRLRDGLIALQKSGKEGQIRGGGGDENFRNLLGTFDVVNLGDDVTSSVGRKWRSAMEKMGFINPDLKGKDKDFQSQIGPPDYISKNGQRLIDAESISGWNECFLRSLCAYYIDNDGLSSPFIFKLKIHNSLLEAVGDSRISMREMALIVQCSDPKSNISDIISSILHFRKKRDKSKSKNKFDRDSLYQKAKELELKETIFRDYADTNFRYLKASGLVASKGQGIAIVPEKLSLVRKIIESEEIPENNLIRYKNLCFGASLPTDNIELGRNVLTDLIGLLSSKGETFDISKIDTKDITQITIARNGIEDRLFKLKEIEFASEQKLKTEEISLYMDMLIERSRKTVKRTLRDRTTISIPGGERPAYFEWIIWRAFLAINSLSNLPWEARRFQIDQDFLPVNTAPGGGADVIIELDNIVLVIEVTLTSSSRQEAAEGEPVRRHVADKQEEYSSSGKKVFGLFLAIDIDTNTANTFRLGEWYTKGDVKLALNIVPISLSDFKYIFDTVSDNPSNLLGYLNKFLVECRNSSDLEAPKWKNRIRFNCQKLVNELSS